MMRHALLVFYILLTGLTRLILCKPQLDEKAVEEMKAQRGQLGRTPPGAPMQPTLHHLQEVDL